MGQATTPESYWEGMGAGSAAVDRAFENLMTEREEHLPMLAPPGAATVLAESLRNRPIVVDDVAEQRKLLSQLNPLPDSGKDPLAEVQDLTEYATALKKLLEESGLPKDSIKDLEVTKNFANRLRGIIAPGVPVGSVVDTMDADALRRVWNGLPAIRTAALMPPIAPAAQADFLRLENLADLDGMRKLVKDHTPAPSSPVTPAVPTTGSVPASSPAVATSDDYGQSIRVDGKIVNRVENGQLTLLRLMFRPNGFSPQQFRAWDLL